MSKLGELHITKHTGAKHTATVIFFHGSGSNGADLKKWIGAMMENFSFPHIKVLYPTAPLQPYDATGGTIRNVWFDRVAVSPSVPEKLESLTKIEEEVKTLIKNENDADVPSNRIIVGGFSMGGSLSFHTAFRWEQSLAGAFVVSSFLNNNSIVYQDIRNVCGVQLPPLLQIHGDSDNLVDISWGRSTFHELQTLGVRGQFHVIPHLDHSLSKDCVTLIKEFVEKHLPEV